MSTKVFIDRVNDENLVIGKVAESDLYSGPNHHWIVHVMIRNDQAEILLQRRSPHDTFLPGAWVTSAGGHVHSGETPEAAASRELMEELGIQCPLQRLGEFVYEVPTVPGMKKFLSVYQAQFDGALHINPDEVAATEFVALAEIAERFARGDSFHPELVAVLQKLYQLPLADR